MRYLTAMCLAVLPIIAGDATARSPRPHRPPVARAPSAPAGAPVYNSLPARPGNGDIPGRNPAAGALP